MINLILAGGLGNQMFEYAYARALSEEFRDPDIVINTYYNEYFKLYHKMIKGHPEYCNYQLNLFELNSNVTQISAVKGWIKGLEIVPGALIRFGVYKPNTTEEKYKEMTRNGKFKMLDMQNTYYAHSEICKKKNKTVLGWFQSEKFFANIRPILLKEFQFKFPPPDRSKEIIDELSSCNSVCVHIRRGDILNPAYSYFPRCNEQYFRNSMKFIAERSIAPVFYIFSNDRDDIEWIKGNYHWEFPVRYVDLGNPGYEDMRLMYYCKHFILSQSSFSWWGSYMSQNPDKIVTTPILPTSGGWLKDKNNEDRYRDEMVKIQVNLEEY